MNKRLFISTKETFMVNERITRADYQVGKGEVMLYHMNENGECSSGAIMTSSSAEATWFVKNIFATIDNQNDIVYDWPDQRVYIPKDEIVNPNEENETLTTLKIQEKHVTNAIKEIEL